MKSILITGATGAIGRAALTALARRGELNLVVVGRNYEKMKEIALGVEHDTNRIDLLEADLADLSSVKKLVHEVRKNYPSLDALLNIASVYKSTRTLTPQRYETMFATNHLGPFYLTTGLLDLIRRTPGAKVLTVSAPSTSRIDFENLNGEKKFSSLSAFGSSKMMNLLMAFGLSAAFKDSGHASFAYHPGLIKSELLHEAPALLRKLIHFISASPEGAGDAIAELVLEGSSPVQNGKFYNQKLREIKAAPLAYDRVIQHKLWAASEELTSVLI